MCAASKLAAVVPDCLVAVDATYYLFRSFHAIRDLRTRDGQPTNALYGLAGTLVALRERYADAAIACVIDAPGKNFRHELYPEYKATRKKTDPDLLAQFALAKTMIKALGMALYCIDAVEADDVIATIATGALGAGRKVVVASADKDLMYLAGKGCTVFDPSKNQELDAAAVKAKYGVLPEQMNDYLSLVGDTSDNVPGVTGVGPKTAVKWLGEHKSLDAIIASADKIPGKVGVNLQQAVPQLPLTRKLIQLREDVTLDQDPLQLAIPQANVAQVTKLCEQLRFNPNLQARMLKVPSVPAAAGNKLDVQLACSAKQIAQATEALSSCRRLGVHLEADGGDAPSANIVGVACYGSDQAFYLPLEHTGDFINVSAERKLALSLLNNLLGDPEREVCVYDAKSALHALANAGVTVHGKLKDIRLMAYSLDSSTSGSLEATCRRYLDYQVPGRATVLGGRDKPGRFAELEPKAAAQLAGQWARCTHDLRIAITRQFDKSSSDLYRKVEQPLLPVLAAMEQAGIILDTARLSTINTDLRKRQAELEAQIFELGGEQVNLNSPKQLAELLYDRLHLDAGRKTRGGARSTNEAELERLAANSSSEVPKLLLAYRHMTKLVGTYTEALPQRINLQTGRLHTRFIQTGAVTGRLASVDPNLQNIPIRTPEGHQIRRCFVAPPGSVLLSADYSQIELRILAHFSGDQALLEAFQSKEDVHRRTAAEIYAISSSQVNEEQRRFAKTVNFGLIYGMGAYGLARRMGISNREASDIIKSYFDSMPGVARYLRELREQAAADKVVTTLLGRRIAFQAREHTAQGAGGALRAAVNAPMQGTAADIIKLAMTAVYCELQQRGLKTRLLLQVHDELVLEAPAAEVEQVRDWLAPKMAGVIKLAVPLEVEVGSGQNWDEAH